MHQINKSANESLDKPTDVKTKGIDWLTEVCHKMPQTASCFHTESHPKNDHLDLVGMAFQS